MSRSVPTVPNFLSPFMIPFTALIDLIAGKAVCVDAATGKVTIQDNTILAPVPTLGVTVNNARAGQTVYVQVGAIAIVPKTGLVIPLNHFCGDTDGTGNLNDLGLSIPQTQSSVGVCIAHTSTQNVIAVQPAFGAPASVIVVPNFADNETPAGLINGSNTVFTLAHAPNPALSLVAFLRNNAGNLPVSGSPLVAGVHFVLTANSMDLSAGSNPVGAPSAGGGIHFTVSYRY